MKPTLNINLAGYPFVIDDDAYRLLKDYLDTIRYAFESKDDVEDLASDIESRIAEILLEKENGHVRIVTIEEISKVIERIGRPSEFIEIDEDSVENKSDEGEIKEEKVFEEKFTPPPYDSLKYSQNPFVRKRLFRDPQNSMIGGVCAGLAHYLHIDVTVVRLLTVLLFFLSATTVAIVYIILWIVVPEARTPLQRMQMMGEDTTVENIGKRFTGNYQENGNSENYNSQKGGFMGFLSTALSIFIKILIFLGLLITIPVLIGLSAGLIGCVIAVFIVGIAIFGGLAEAPYGWFDSTLEGQFVFFILLAVIGGIISIGIPLWLLFRMLWKKKDNSDQLQNNPNNQKILLIIWLCGIALLAVFTVKSVKKGHQIEIFDKIEWIKGLELESEVDDMVDAEDIKDIKISEGEIIITSKEGRKVKIKRGNVTVESSESITEETPDTVEMVKQKEPVKTKEVQKSVESKETFEATETKDKETEVEQAAIILETDSVI